MVIAPPVAALLSDHRKDAASLARAADIAQRFERSANPLYLDTLGWVRYRRGDYPSAAGVLELAAKASGLPEIHRHLEQARAALGRG